MTKEAPPRRLIACFAFALAVGLVPYSSEKLDRRVRASSNPPIYLPKADHLRPFALGYDNALADLLWFRTINYFGDHYRSDGSYPWLASMCDLVTDLDPKAFYVYRFAGMILPWEAKEPEQGIQLLEKGVARIPEWWPDYWLLPYWLAFTYYFFLDDYDKAVEHLRRAAAQPNVPAAVPRLLAVLTQHRYGPETTVQLLRDFEHLVEDDRTKEVLRKHQKEALLAADLAQIDAATSRYRERFGRDPNDISELVEHGLLDRVPPDPFGGSYQLDAATGKARSSTGHVSPKLYESEVRRSMVEKRKQQGP